MDVPTGKMIVVWVIGGVIMGVCLLVGIWINVVNWARKRETRDRAFWDSMLRARLLGPLAGCFRPSSHTEPGRAEKLLVPRLLDCFRILAPKGGAVANSLDPLDDLKARNEIREKLKDALTKGECLPSEVRDKVRGRPLLCALIALQQYHYHKF